MTRYVVVPREEMAPKRGRALDALAVQAAASRGPGPLYIAVRTHS